MLFFRAFDQRYQPKYLSGVQDIRKAHEGIAELARQLDALPGDATGSERWHALAEKAGNLQAFAGREQRAALQAGLRKAYTYVVLPTHARKAEQVAGQAQGLEGLRALMQLKSEFERDASLAGTATAWPDVARSRQAAIISAISKEQHKRIDALGTGLESMERGVAWYRDYRLSFDESTITAMPQLREPIVCF